MASEIPPDGALVEVRDASDTSQNGGSIDGADTSSTPVANDEMESDSDSDDAYRLTQNASKPRKVSEKKRVDAAAFQAWVNRKQREITSKPETGAGNPRQPSASEMFQGRAKIIESPREYQIDLFERAKTRNIIVVLDTGKMATFIF